MRHAGEATNFLHIINYSGDTWAACQKSCYLDGRCIPSTPARSFCVVIVESSEKRKYNRRRTVLFFFSITRTAENHDVGTARESKRRKSDLFAPHTSARFISRVARIILRPRKSVLRHEPVCITYMNLNHARVSAFN